MEILNEINKEDALDWNSDYDSDLWMELVLAAKSVHDLNIYI